MTDTIPSSHAPLLKGDSRGVREDFRKNAVHQALPKGVVLAALAALLVLLMAACGGAAAPEDNAPSALGRGPESAGAVPNPSGIQPILATTVLRVGSQRVAFLLAGPDAVVKAPEAMVTSAFLGDGPDPVQGTGETRRAAFHLWPYGIRGAYSAEMSFDRPGRWLLDITVDSPEISGAAQLIVNVAEEVRVPEIGAVPPLSRTKTLHGAGRIEELTTDYSPDPDLYQITVADAAASGRPTVIVFATPAFCTSATCGPQVDTVSELKDRHKGAANFIHVEIYDNPDEIQGDLSRAEVAQAVHEWGLSAIPGWFNESWVFVLDAQGQVTHRFEGFATLQELEEALQSVLPRA